MSEHPWTFRENEPTLWYERFSRYYLPLGPTRTLLRAYMACLAIEDPDKLPGDGEPLNTAPPDWSQMADIWEWLERGQSYDEFLYRESGAVELAREFLKNTALEAAEALRGALENSRLTVAAAKEILDRAGIPAVSRLDIRRATYTSDELEEAYREIKQWEKESQSADSESSG